MISITVTVNVAVNPFLDIDVAIQPIQHRQHDNMIVTNSSNVVPVDVANTSMMTSMITTTTSRLVLITIISYTLNSHINM
jgi:hypothetical protein